MARSCFIDMGNSRIKLWLCEEQKVIARYAVAHQYSANILMSGLPPEFYHHFDFVGVDTEFGQSFSSGLLVGLAGFNAYAGLRFSL